MRAAVLYETHQPFVIEEVDIEAPRAGEVMVRLVASGVCRSDYHLVTGGTPYPMPVVAGHEGAGIVEAVGPGVTRVAVGDHVVLSWVPTCGECFFCQHGLPAQCEGSQQATWDGTLLDGTTRLSKAGQPLYLYCSLGTFAEYTVVSEQSCVPVRRDVPFEIAALVGCAVTTGVGAVLNTARLTAGSSAVIFGCGGVGLSMIQGAALGGATRIIAVDVMPAKFELARAMGATHTLLASEALEGIRDLTGGYGADYVFEASGHPDAMMVAYEAARRGGRIVYVGLASKGTTMPLPMSRLPREDKTLMGSYYGAANPQRDFPQLIEHFFEGRLPLERLISRTYRLDQINEAFADMLEGEVGRGVILFEQGSQG